MDYGLGAGETCKGVLLHVGWVPHDEITATFLGLGLG